MSGKTRQISNVKSVKTPNKSKMSPQQAQEYLKKLAEDPGSRPDGLEGEIMSRLDEKTSHQEKLAQHCQRLKQELESSEKQLVALEGEINGLIDIIVSAENARRQAG